MNHQKINSIILTAIFTLAHIANAQSYVNGSNELLKSDSSFHLKHNSRKNISLKEIEQGVDARIEAKRWQNGSDARPIMGIDGLLQYPFGQLQPELTCAPLRACDIQLQAGEIINNVILGDTVRWILAPAKTGEGSSITPHVIIKPTESDLKTNLIITTNRRTYTMTLNSRKVNYVSRIGFYYPADMVQDWDGAAELAKQQAAIDTKRHIANIPITNIEQLNLDGYQIKGDRKLAWYPIRVFDDGVRVWIQMPVSLQSNEAPVLVLLNRQGHSELVNYRIKQADQGGTKVTYYIVDKLFDRAGLIIGVGRNQQKIEIVKHPQSSNGTQPIINSSGNYWNSPFDTD